MTSQISPEKLVEYMETDQLKPINLVGTLPVHPTKRYRSRSVSDIDMIVLHCTDRDWDVYQLNEYDVEGKLTYTRPYDRKTITDINHIARGKPLPAITYHNCIGYKQVYHTLDYNQISWHASGYNSRSVAVAMLYRTTNPNTKKADISPPHAMIKLTQCRLGEICLDLGLTPTRVKFHRELKGTGWDWIKGRKRLLKSCPGPFLDPIVVRTNVAKYMQIKMKLRDNLYTGAIDGDFGPKSMAAFNFYLEKR